VAFELLIEVGVAHAGKGGYDADPKDKVSSIVVDFLTPETDTSMWYFWGMARNFNPRDRNLTAQIREGQAIGAMVTLRRERMWEFFDRLVSFGLPRVRDFRGVSPKAFDGRGNYTLGIKEQIVFPEIEYDKVDRIHGMNVSFVTTAKNDEQGRALLAELGMPFRK